MQEELPLFPLLSLPANNLLFGREGERPLELWRGGFGPCELHYAREPWLYLLLYLPILRNILLPHIHRILLQLHQYFP